MDRGFYYKVAVIILAVAFFAWNFKIASSGLLDQNMGYISDDVWYVSSARNTLREFWHLQPKSFENGQAYATVLAYNNESYNAAIKTLQQSGAFYRILKDDYQKHLRQGWSKAFALLASEETLEKVEKVEMVQVYRGYPYPDYTGITEYMNLEHPPLVRYVLVLTMLVDDRPLTWRIPSLILGSSILMLAYLAARRIFGEMAGIAAAFFVFTEQTVRAMSLVAMLDIYLSFFTILALYLTLRRSLLASALAIGLAGSAKMSGIFTIPSLLVSFLRSLKIVLVVAVVVPVLVYLTISIPVILYLQGFNPWINELLAALKWHVTPRPDGPPTVNPLGLLLGSNAFPLSFVPPVSATPNFLLNLLVIPLTFFLTPLAVKGVLKGAGTALTWFWAVYLGYIAIYLAGNTTLYTFYAVQFTPLAAVISSGIIFVINNPRKIVEAMQMYRKVLGVISKESISICLKRFRRCHY